MKIYIETCEKCGHKNLVIEFETKIKWLKGKTFFPFGKW